MSDSARTLTTNGAWSLSHQVARIGCLAIVTIALSRHFGPQLFGAFAFGIAFTRIFGVIAAFGMDRVIVRHLLESPAARPAIVRRALSLKLILATSSYLLMVVVCIIGMRDRLTLSIAAIAGTALLFQAFDVFDFAFQAQHRFAFIFLGRALPIAVSCCVKLAAISLNAPIWVFAILESVEAALIAIALFILYVSVPAEQAAAHVAPVRHAGLLAEGFPLLLSALAVMMYMRSDVILLGKLAGYGAAGIYSAASNICEACALFPMAFAPALFPVLVRWRRQGRNFYHRQFEKLFLGTIVAGVSVSLLLTLTAPFLIHLLFGDRYSAAIPVLRILAWAPVFVFIGVMQGGYDITEGLTWLATLRTAFGAAINIVLNLLLIPRFGPIGAAWATLISFACSAFLLNGAQSKTRPVFGLQLRALLVWPVLFRPLRYE